MDYPRLLKLDPQTEAEFKGYIRDELVRHRMEDSRFQDDLISQQHAYWAEPPEIAIQEPFRGSSNVIIPLGAIAVEAVHARNMQTIFGLNQLVSGQAMSDDYTDTERPLERYLDLELRKGIKVRKPINDGLLELEKFGTGILKSGFIKIVKRAVRTVGNSEQEFDVITRQGATLDACPLANFIMPYAASDPQTASWCGEVHVSTPYDLQMMEYSGLFDKGTYDKIKSFLTNINSPLASNDFQVSQEELEHTQPVLPSRINWVELWISYNIDRDPKGRVKELVVYYHPDSDTLMGARYNWYDDLHRPYRIGIYTPIEHRWRGLGIIKQSLMFQEEITMRHRLQLDNATLANIRMFKIQKQAGYSPDEPIFPGKMWFLDSMDQIETFQMGEIYPSAYNSEQSTLNYAQQRLGVNELTLGQPAVGTPGTASDVLSRVQEGNKKFGFIFENIREWLSESFVDVACNIQQFGPSNVEFFERINSGDLVKTFFTLPQASIRAGMLIDLKAAGQLDNKMLDRQNLTQVTGAYQQYVSGILQLAQMNQDPTLIGAIVKQGMLGGTELMHQLLETFDIQNLNRILLDESIFRQGGSAGVSGASQNQPLVNNTQTPPSPTQLLPSGTPSPT